MQRLQQVSQVNKVDVRIALLQYLSYLNEVLLLEVVEKVGNHPGLYQALRKLLVVLFVQRRDVVDVDILGLEIVQLKVVNFLRVFVDILEISVNS